MGLFGDFFDDPLFDLDGNGTVDTLEEAIAFDLFLGGNSSGDNSGSDTGLFDEEDDLFNEEDDLFDEDEDLFCEDDDIFDSNDDIFDDEDSIF